MNFRRRRIIKLFQQKGGGGFGVFFQIKLDHFDIFVLIFVFFWGLQDTPIWFL